MLLSPSAHRLSRDAHAWANFSARDGTGRSVGCISGGDDAAGLHETARLEASTGVKRRGSTEPVTKVDIGVGGGRGRRGVVFWVFW